MDDEEYYHRYVGNPKTHRTVVTLDLDEYLEMNDRLNKLAEGFSLLDLNYVVIASPDETAKLQSKRIKELISERDKMCSAIEEYDKLQKQYNQRKKKSFLVTLSILVRDFKHKIFL